MKTMVIENDNDAGLVQVTGAKPRDPEQNYDALVFAAPQESPRVTIPGRDLTIIYNGMWVRFRDGKIIIEQEADSTPAGRPCDG